MEAAGSLPVRLLSGEEDPEIRDLHILLILVGCWTLLLLHWLWSLNHGVVATVSGFVDKKDVKKVHQRESLHKHQEDEDARGTAAKGSRTMFLFEPEFGVPRVRSYAAFCAGDSPPPKPPVSFQHSYSTSRRLHMYRMIIHGALARCSSFVIACGLFASTLVWLLRNLAALLHGLGAGAVVNSDAITSHLAALSAVQKVLLPLGSTILAFYVKAKLAWFNDLISDSWKLQGKLGDLALILGSAAAPANDRAVMASKYRVHRYLNLVHYLVYNALAVEYSEDTLAELETCHLITAEERKILENSLMMRQTVLVWLGATIRQLAQAGRIRMDVLARAMQVLRELHCETDTLAKELVRVAPISFAQLMQLMVDFIMVLTPPSLAQSLVSERDGSSVYVWPMLGTMILAIFYQGSLRLITALEYPFGSDLDDLHPDWLLMSSERSTYLLLSEKLPAGLTGDMPCDDKLRKTTVSDADTKTSTGGIGLPGSVMVDTK